MYPDQLKPADRFVLYELCKQLRLSGTSSRKSIIDQCCKFLESKTEYFLDSGMEDEDFAFIPEALKSNTTLTNLHLLNLKDQQIEQVILQSRSLVKLNLSWNMMENETCIAVANALRQNNVITHLFLWQNKIEPEGGIALAECLKTNSALKKLFLANNKLGDEGCTAIANVLKTNKTITELDLSWNKIKKEGGEAIADCLKTNNTLARLHLEGNGIGNDGCIAIASALETNTKLFYLNLARNCIRKEVVFKFASTLRLNDRITELNLTQNRIGDEGYDAIIATLQTSNMSLTTFDLPALRFDPVRRRKINYYLNLNRAGRKIMLSGSTATKEKQVDALIEACHQNVDTFFNLLLLKPDLCEQQCYDDIVLVGHYQSPKIKKRKWNAANSVPTLHGK